MEKIHYQVSPSSPEAHIFRVTCTITEPDPSGQIMTLPAWIPGSYMIRDFAKNIIQIAAASEGQTLAIEKIDKSTWKCQPTDNMLVIAYDIYSWDLSVRTAHLDGSHGFFNGSSLFLAVQGQTHTSCSVEIQPPPSATPQWHVATTLTASQLDKHGFGLYKAADYDELIDHPVEMGTFSRHTFEACGVTHQLVLTGQFRTDAARICADLKIICEHHIRFFGEPAPFDHYIFLTMVVGDGYGGLEHRASTSLMTSRDSLPIPGDTEISDQYLEFLGLCSHEYFHNWNIKRIKPAQFTPYSLEKETYTRLLWAFEGITSYYDDLALVRSGLIDHKRYLSLLSTTMTRVWQGRGRYKQSVSDSSFDAWTKFYKQDENAPNAIVSYYTKGALIALALDLTIRYKTGGKYSLDDVMRALWLEFGQQKKGIGEDELEVKIAEYSGVELKAFFDTALRGTEDLSLDTLLAGFGVKLKWQYPRAAQQTEVLNTVRKIESKPPLELGIKISNAQGHIKVTHVFDNGAAQKAGIAAGDQLLAFDGLRLTAGNLSKRLQRYSEQDTVEIVGFRRDELMTFNVALQAAEKNIPSLTPSDKNQQQRDQWLGSIHS